MAKTAKAEGWLFDAYPDKGGMRLWVLEAEGSYRTFLDPWHPAFHARGAASGLRRALAFLKSLPYPTSARWTERLELFSGEPLDVLEVRVPPRARNRAVAAFRDLGLTLYDADIHPVQLYHYERGHFPLARCAFEVRDGRLLSWELRDDPWALDYAVPPLRTLHLSLSGSEIAGRLDPNHALRGRLLLTFEGEAHELEGDLAEQIETLAGRLREWDPDLVTTDWGDSVLIPKLGEAARRLGRPLPLSRDADRDVAGRKERSFHTYGRAIYQGGAQYFFGRWHLDLQNSFTLRESGLDGLLEICRIAKIPVQRAARCTIGTALSSMQMDAAWGRGILVPLEKAQAEDFRPASDLLVADKGGLVYEPPVGWFEHVAEYDFVSMYPTMMVDNNISPETVNCPCCPENLVPEIGHNLCRRRQGIVPAVLEPILKKRARYKALAKAGGPSAAVYKRRANAHKWTLVVAFGYQGYRNAKFGKIEAHECVTAWGREVLLRAKEAVERRGLRMLHALVDAVWVQLEPDTDVEALRQAIEAEAGCPVGLEGVYKWLRFCPSKQDKRSGVPARYFGAFSDGELKYRGLACRRHDTPRLFKDLQESMLALMARVDGLAGCRALLPRLCDLVEDRRLRLREGRVTAEELAITFNISKRPEEYVHDTLQVLAAKQLAVAGVTLHVGETVRYVIAAAKDQVKDWRTAPLALMEGGLEYDAPKYLELLERAAKEIIDDLARLEG